MRHLRTAVLAVLALAFSSSTAFAQRSVNTGAGAGGGGFWEWGVDFAGFIMELDPSPTTKTLFCCSGSIRGAKFIKDNMSIEGGLGFFFSSTEAVGTGSSTSSNGTSLEAAFLYHLQADRTKRQFFIRPGFFYTRSSFDNGTTTTSTSSTALMIGGGVKLPSKKLQGVTWRGEARYTMMNDPSASDITLFWGASVYTP